MKLPGFIVDEQAIAMAPILTQIFRGDFEKARNEPSNPQLRRAAVEKNNEGLAPEHPDITALRQAGKLDEFIVQYKQHLGLK